MRGQLKGGKSLKRTTEWLKVICDGKVIKSLMGSLRGKGARLRDTCWEGVNHAKETDCG